MVFKLGSLGGIDGTITYNPANQDNVYHSELNEQGDILLKQKIIEINYVFSGIASDKGFVVHNFKEWLAAAGLYCDKVDETARNCCTAYTGQRVKHRSQDWRVEAYWNLRGLKFCVPCPKPKIDDSVAGQGVVFQEKVMRMAAKPDWDGRLTEVSKEVVLTYCWT